MNRLMIIAIVAGSLATTAGAYTVDVWLATDSVAGTWQLWGTTNCPLGIASYVVNVHNVSTGTKKAPAAWLFTPGGTPVGSVGFTVGPISTTAGVIPSVPDGVQAFGGQDNSSAALVLFGVGAQAGSYSPPAGQVMFPPALEWGWPVLLFEGQYNTQGPAPRIGARTAAIWVSDVGTPYVDCYEVPVNIVPEPASLVLLALAGLTLRRRS